MGESKMKFSHLPCSKDTIKIYNTQLDNRLQYLISIICFLTFIYPNNLFKSLFKPCILAATLLIHINH